MPNDTATYLAITIAVMAASLLGFCTPGNSHDWYPKNCCENRDCHPVDCTQISKDTIYYHYQNMLFSTPQHAFSPDGKCHVCYHYQFIRERQGVKIPRCIFTPHPLSSQLHALDDKQDKLHQQGR